MMNGKKLCVFILAILGFTGVQPIYSDTFTVGDREFLLNGEPYVVKAAELHYPRIPKEYWDQRIKLTKSLGMNTICLYTFWNVHEPVEDDFNFKDQNDLRAFIKLCEENGMKVILRPGPYVCAEWEMGGLPWWLLKKPEIRLRENDPYFLERVEKFQDAVANEVSDLTIDNGGPIIMVQVENEYGAYGEDKEYVRAIKDILRKNFGDKILLFQCDWSSNFTLNGLDDLLWTMNFGTGADVESQFARLKELRPESPLMCSEYWSGWFDKWGANHETRPAEDMVAGIGEMLSKGISFSLYMTHGGTNWSHWAGANSPGYSPDVTSYDYNAPINENGQPTEKFWLLRDLLQQYSEEVLPSLPELVLPSAVERFEFKEIAPLWENLPLPVHSMDLVPMEMLNQGFGSILYSTTLPDVQHGSKLTINDVHDFAQVFIDGVLAGTLDRRNGEREIILDSVPQGTRLQILVEATGRINFGQAIKDYKGITDNVTITFNGETRELKNWDIYLLPDELEFYESMDFRPLLKSQFGDRMDAGAYKAKFTVDSPSDTFLNFETWGKGLVYVNGKGIGRFWEIGPQQTLYVPGPWLVEGENEILVFDILGPTVAESEGLILPVLDKVKVFNREVEANIFEIDDKAVGEFSFENGNGWKTIMFDNPLETSVILIELIDLLNEEELPAIAELYFLDSRGDRISRENWSVVASDENIAGGNHSVDKIFDLQESTYWTPSKRAQSYWVKIDLGDEYEVTGIQYLPRMETGAPGAVKDFRVYSLDK